MKKIKVKLKDNHPHAGEIGYIDVNDNNTVPVTISYPGAPTMIELSLENCCHGIEKCYAVQKDCVYLGMIDE